MPKQWETMLAYRVPRHSSFFCRRRRNTFPLVVVKTVRCERHVRQHRHYCHRCLCAHHARMCDDPSTTPQDWRAFAIHCERVARRKSHAMMALRDIVDDSRVRAARIGHRSSLVEPALNHGLDSRQEGTPPGVHRANEEGLAQCIPHTDPILGISPFDIVGNTYTWGHVSRESP